MTTIDARGRSCPEPVVLTRSALLSDPDGVTVKVDNICAVENITRFATNQGYQVKREDGDEEWTLVISK